MTVGVCPGQDDFALNTLLKRDELRLAWKPRHKCGHLPLKKGRSASEASREGIEYSAFDPHPNPPLFKGREPTETAATAPTKIILL
jgi:hypothetical protein